MGCGRTAGKIWQSSAGCPTRDERLDPRRPEAPLEPTLIVIVGAGAAGLAVARRLQRRSLDAVVLEQASTGHVWAEHYDGLRLHTLKQVSALPCLRMPARLPDFPSGAQVRDYLVQYREHFGLDVREGVRVHSARQGKHTWHLRTSAGDLEPRVLVAATGIWSEPVRPEIPGLSGFPGTVVHSAHYRNQVPFTGRRVLVIGAGNSGCEIAARLGGIATGVSLSVRSRVLFVPRPNSAVRSALSASVLRLVPPRAGNWLVDRVRRDNSDIGLPPPERNSAATYPVVGDELPDAVRSGTVEVVAAVRGFDGDRAEFDDGSSGRFDAVVLATGFRPALDWLDRSAVRYSERGTPLVDRHWRSVVDHRLVCVGFEYPNTEGWLQALGRVSAQAADGVQESLRVK